MTLIFKSKLLRNEIKHWILIVCLFIWGTIATVFALQNREKTILIGIDESGTRLITENTDRLLENELKNFLKFFFDHYYVYDEKNYLSQMDKATELISNKLWETEKPKILELNEKLKKTPLIQSMEIQNIDLVADGKIEAILLLKVKARTIEQQVRLKVNLAFERIERRENNAWGYEITEISDATLLR
ncbi:hypothetical protein [Bdellovibrio sp. HCB-162]|uniref:hypothetical protein n=1 Tax=Bdellovibrio sp. HCB-162 TaxID=3394234 RepID=UPI0039BCB18C